MGYKVSKSHVRKDGTTAWRVIWRKQKNKTKLARHVKESEYAALGIHPSMSMEEASAKLKQLNLQEAREYHEARRNAIMDRLAKEDDLECEFLPKVFVVKFENEHLSRKYVGKPEQLKQVLTHWRTAKRAIREANLPLDQWGEYPQMFYNYFMENQVSWSYVKKLLRMLNEWGNFMVRQTKQGSFYNIPTPDSVWRGKIQDAFHDSGKNKVSDPITPKALKDKQDKLDIKHYNFIYLTVWLGLRPQEVDQLTNKTRYSFFQDAGETIFRVYQPKLKRLPRDKRWKLIPLLTPEQKACVEIITSGTFDRPHAKTVKKHFGQRTTNYGGRKGFVALMKSLGEDMDNIRKWMGHTSAEMTELYYDDASIAHWKNKKAA